MQDTFAIPDDITPRAREAAEIILAQARALNISAEGEGRLFYTPAEWRKRGERYGLNADLIVVHEDGLKLAILNAARSDLEKRRFYCEEAETWYSIILNQPLGEKRD
jgi:hypothetical protein